MKIMSRLVMFLIIALATSGCRTLSVNSDKNATVEGPLLSLSSYQQKALDYEKAGDAELALANWRIAENLVGQKISALTDHMENNAEKHYQKGLSFKKAGQKQEAVREFLTALRYDKNHKFALKKIKGMAIPSRNIAYTVRDGDTFESIAGQVYKNPNYDFIVKSFVGQDSKGDVKKLTPGQTIRLPILELEFTRRFFKFNKELNLARKLYKDKDYQGILPLAENILIHVPDNEEAVFLINSSYYGLAEKYFNEENYLEAIEMLKLIDPRFRNVKNRILYIERVQAGRIKEARDNVNDSNYRKALAFEKKKLYHKALSAYESVDHGYMDLKERLSRLKQIMRKESERHYLNGVKYFSDQKLEHAIGEWKESLNFDPNNTKAKKDIENASQLLKKINEIK